MLAPSISMHTDLLRSGHTLEKIQPKLLAVSHTVNILKQVSLAAAEREIFK